MSILTKAAPRLWSRINRINPLFKVKIGEKNLRVPSYAMEWTPCWKTELVKHFVKLNPGDFIDIGANVGQTLYDFYSLNHQGRYIGFEPDPNCVSALEEMIRRNGVERYAIAPVGLSDSNTILSLYFNEARDLGATMVANLRPAVKCDSKLVPVFRFDDIREALAISEIAVMKIDVEGAELQVLAGMPETLARLKPPIICEVLLMDGNADKANYRNNVASLMSLLTCSNYTVFRINKTNDAHYGHLARLTPVTEFPLDIWTKATAETNDYLFIPADKESQIPSAA